MNSSAIQHQGLMGSGNSMENMLISSKQQNQQERKLARPQQEAALKCPRCDSINTKFCYYNNYSLSQPRYFCKSCRRYWTKGGTLRNVPVGGGCRKNKRSSLPSSSSSFKKTQFESHNPNPLPSNCLPPLPPLSCDSNDLTLAFARLHKHSNPQLGFDHHDQDFSSALGNLHFDILGNPNIINQNGNNGFYGEVENCGSDQMMVAYNDQDNLSTSNYMTSMKQKLCNFGRGENHDDDQSKILFGFPWQISDGINDGIGDHLDSGREISSWNNIHGITSYSNWHGVLNSPST